MIRTILVCLVVASTVFGAASTSSAQGAQVGCVDRASANSCDSDGDRIPNTSEISICGSSTCATGVEDADRDGIPDWSEIAACGSAECAAPARDTDDDGIPDFAEQFVCGNVACATALEDADADKIGDWVEFVICGDRSCANGREDYDGSGVSDAVELAACVKWVGNSGPGSVNPLGVAYFVTPGGVVTQVVLWPLYLAIGLVGLAAFGLLVWWLIRRQRGREDPPDSGFYARAAAEPDATTPFV